MKPDSKAQSSDASDGSAQPAPTTEPASFLVSPPAPIAHPDPDSYAGPGAAASGSVKEEPVAVRQAPLDTPFNGALQPPVDSVVNQGSLLDDMSATTVDEPLPLPDRPVSRQRVIGLGLLTVGLLAAILLGVRLELNKSHQQEARLASPSSKLQLQQLPTATISKQLGTADAESAVTVNGQLQVTNSLVLQPSTETGPAVTGQMYYDSATNALAYYNGKQYVSLQGGGNSSVTNNTYVTNITNASGGGPNINGTPGALALFTGSAGLGGSLISQTGTTLNVGLGGASAVNIGNSGQAGDTTIAGGVAGVKIKDSTGAVTINGAGVAIDSSADASITTDAAANISGSISIQTGNSSGEAAGNVSVDTGSGLVTGEVVGNKTFEDGVDNMYPWFGTTIAQSSAQAHNGTESLAITTTAQFWGVDEQNISQAAPVIAGHHYFFSFWIRAGSTPRPINVCATWSNLVCTSNSVSLGTVTDSTTAWTEVTGTGVAPGGATYVTWVFGGGSGAAGEVHYIDDLQVTDLSSSSSVSELDLGATNAQFVNIGNMNEIGATTIDGGSGIALNSGAGPISANGGAITISGTAASSLSTTSGSLTLGAGGGTGGGVIVKPQADSTTAFQVQNASSTTTLLNVDTTGSTVSLGVGSVASFGNTRAGNVGGCCNVGKLEASKFTTVGGGALSSISAFVGWGGTEPAPNNQFQLAIYADNGSGTAPGAYVASTAVSTLAPTAGGGLWNTVPISATLSAGTTYWLVYWNNTVQNDSNNALSYTYPATSGKVYRANVTWGSGPDNGLPATFPSGTLTSGESFSLYASFATAGPALVLGSGGLVTASGPVLFQDPTNSLTAFQVQDNVGNTILAVDTADSVVEVTNLAISGHIITSGTTPTIAAGAAACTSPTVSVSGNDVSGTITVTTGTGCPGGGTLATLTFASAYAAPPTVVLTPGSPISQTLGAYVDDSTLSTTTFDLGTNATPFNSTTFKWNYLVIQ